MDVTAFVVSQLPPLPARVLEVGCGEGELARAVEGAGYDVTAIDPVAPQGPIFRRTKLEDLDEERRFDAVVAVYSLHHVADLDVALDKVVRLLRPNGRLILEEFAWDRLDTPTADWFYGQQRALAAAGRGERPPATLEDFRREWLDEHRELHGYEAMRAAVDRRFDERSFMWLPYLYGLLNGVTTEAIERVLIEAGAIAATGFRYVGSRRRD